MPDKLHVERSREIKAPAEFPFQQVNVMKNWEQWSPWYKVEPSQTLTYNDIAEGKGAAYTWKGKETGAGTMGLKEVTPNEQIICDLVFTEPFAGHPDTRFLFKKVNDSTTQVLWSYDEHLGFVNKVMMRAMGMDEKGMDKMLGDSFAEGLDGIKSLSEKAYQESKKVGLIQVPALPAK